MNADDQIDVSIESIGERTKLKKESVPQTKYIYWGVIPDADCVFCSFFSPPSKNKVSTYTYTYT